jgi:hypothetical protein
MSRVEGVRAFFPAILRTAKCRLTRLTRVAPTPLGAARNLPARMTADDQITNVSIL